MGLLKYHASDKQRGMGLTAAGLWTFTAVVCFRKKSIFAELNILI
jgi:hypothetical protein